MKVFVILALAATAMSRPEAGYSYNQPSSSYGTPGGGGCFGGVGGSCGGLGGEFGGGSLIQKHIYVHVPPPEAPEDKPIRPIAPQAPPQKHYKIIFIKAPTPPTPTAPVIPALQQQDEQKTLIYVLVKKPEEAPEISLPTITPTQPSKPEVYFIKYKTQKEVTGGFGGGRAPSGPPVGVVQGFNQTAENRFASAPSPPYGLSTNYGPPGGFGPY